MSRQEILIPVEVRWQLGNNVCVPLDFIPELCCSPWQPQGGHKLCSHSLFIFLSVLQSSMVADTDGQEK